MRHEYAAKIPQATILSKLQPFITNKAKQFTEELIGDILRTIGCDRNQFKLGRTQIFFRPNNEQYIDYLNALKEEDAKELGIKISRTFYIRQRHSLWIRIRFLGKGLLRITTQDLFHFYNSIFFSIFQQYY